MLILEVLNYSRQQEETILLEAIVSQPVDTVVYSKYLSDKDIPVKYFESSEVNSKDNLHFNKTHWRVTNNNENLYDNLTYRFYSKSFTLPFKDVVITTSTFTSKHGSKVPLFYKHKRKLTEANVYFIELGDTFQVDEGYVIENNYLFVNYINDFNPRTYSYRVYFVSGIDINGNPFNELLNIEPAFKKASWEDIDLDTGMLSGNVYEVSEEGENYIYSLNPIESECKTLEYYVLPISTNVIKLLEPETFSIYSPWLPRVTNGVCFDTNTYKVVDYETQPFNPEYGLIKLNYKNCFRVSNNLIKLPVSKIKIKPNEFLHLELYIYDSEYKLLNVITTNTDIVGQQYSDTDINYSEGIASWDEYYGFVELDSTINNDQIIEATFFYEADSYIYTDVNLNPFQNEKILHNKYFFYIRPWTNTTVTKNIHHLLLDEEDRIIESSQFPLLNNNDYNQNTVIAMRLKDFKLAYMYGNDNNFNYMELGEITYKDSSYLDESLSFDYQRDHEIDQLTYKKVLNRNWKILQSRYGYGDTGQYYQENNIVLLEAPIDILTNYGGTYTEQELDRLFRRKLPAGRDIIIEYVYPKSILDFNNDNKNEITITMSWEKPGTYYLEKSTNIDFSKKEIVYTVESNTLESLSYTDTDLESGKVYYYSVRIDNYLSGEKIGVQAR